MNMRDGETMKNLKDAMIILEKDVEEKMIFFRDCNDPRFLQPFKAHNLMNFDDNASFALIGYLSRIKNTNKNDVIDVIKDNKDELANMRTFYTLVDKIISNFNIVEDIQNQLPYQELLKNSDSIYLIKMVLTSEIPLVENIHRECFKALFKYEIKNNDAVFADRDYYISEIVRNKQFKENLRILLVDDELFTFCINLYKEIYAKTHNEHTKNSTFDIYNVQTIEDTKFKNLDENYMELPDVLIDLIGQNFRYNINQKRVESLLNDDIFMLRKVALFSISKHPKEYKDILEHFLNNQEYDYYFHKICCYEMVEAFKVYSFLNDSAKDSLETSSDTLIETIRAYVEKFPIEYEDDKYEILHGLKWNEEFKKEFERLKDKLKYDNDIPNVGIIHRSGGGGLVHDIAPIDKKEFKEKSFAQQVDYLNQEIKYNDQWKQIDSDNVEKESEQGLANLFKECLQEEPDAYLTEGSVVNLQKLIFKKSVLEAMTAKVTEVNIKTAVGLIKDFLRNRENVDNNFYSLVVSFANKVIKEKRNQKNLIYPFITMLIDEVIQEDRFKDENGYIIGTINNVDGVNWDTFLSYVTDDYAPLKSNELDLAPEYIQYFDKGFKSNSLGFFVHLGIDFAFFHYNFKKSSYDFLGKVLELEGEKKTAFLEGFLGYCSYIDPFIELKTFIMDVLKDGGIKRENKKVNQDVRGRFAKLMTSAYVKLGQKDLFNYFKKIFDKDDYKNVLFYLSSKEHEGSDLRAIELLNELISENVINTDEDFGLILRAYFKNLDKESFLGNSEKIKTFLLGTQNTEKIDSYNIDKSLKKLLKILDNDTLRDIQGVFNCLLPFIAKQDYIYKSPETIKQICEKLVDMNQNDLAEEFANSFCNTDGLKVHRKGFEKFLRD